MTVTVLSDADRQAAILAAFERLDQVARRAGVYSLDPAVDLEDFIQTGAEAVVREAWRYDPDNPGGVPLAAWLWQAAKWAMIDHARRIGERRARIDQGRVARALLEHPDDNDADGFEAVAGVDIHRLTSYAAAAADHTVRSGIRTMEIHTALSLLPDPMRAVVRLHCVNGFDRDVVAAMLHINEATIDQHIQSARRHLRATLNLRFRHDRRRTPTPPSGITVAAATLEWAQATWQRASDIGVAAAADEHGCSHMTLRRVWEHHGLPLPSRPKAIVPSRQPNPSSPTRGWAEQAFALAAEHGAAEAARRLGVSRSGLYDAFNKHDLGRPQAPPGRTREWAEQAFAYAAEHGFNAAVTHTGTSRATLRRAFRKYQLGRPCQPSTQPASEVAA